MNHRDQIKHLAKSAMRERSAALWEAVYDAIYRSAEKGETSCSFRVKAGSLKNERLSDVILLLRDEGFTVSCSTEQNPKAIFIGWWSE